MTRSRPARQALGELAAQSLACRHAPLWGRLGRPRLAHRHRACAQSLTAARDRGTSSERRCGTRFVASPRRPKPRQGRGADRLSAQADACWQAPSANTTPRKATPSEPSGQPPAQGLIATARAGRPGDPLSSRRAYCPAHQLAPCSARDPRLSDAHATGEMRDAPHLRCRDLRSCRRGYA